MTDLNEPPIITDEEIEYPCRICGAASDLMCYDLTTPGFKRLYMCATHAEEEEGAGRITFNPPHNPL